MTHKDNNDPFLNWSSAGTFVKDKNPFQNF